MAKKLIFLKMDFLYAFGRKFDDKILISFNGKKKNLLLQKKIHY